MADLRPIPIICVNFVAKYETLVLRVYDDKQPDKRLVTGDEVLGKLTAGYGHTGPDLVIGMEVTQAMADAWLSADLDSARTELYDRVGAAIVALMTDEQYSALLSFTFNLGADPTWNIWKVLKAQQWDSVPAEIVKFVYWNGVKSSGLVARRNAEVVLWSTNEPGTNSDPLPPSSVIRDDPTPPAPIGTPPLHQQPGFIAAATTAVVGAGSAAYPIVQQVSAGLSAVTNSITPYTASPHINTIYTVLITILAGLAATSVVLLWLKHKNDTKPAQSVTAH